MDAKHLQAGAASLSTDDEKNPRLRAAEGRLLLGESGEERVDQGEEENEGDEEAKEGEEEEDEYEEDQVALKIIDLDAALQLQESGCKGGGDGHHASHQMGSGSSSSRQARWKYLNQVMKEVQLLEKCQHDNIVKMYEAFQWPPCYLVLSMELLPGGSLRDLYASAGPLPEPIIANLMQ